jgi:hypothetical protein
LGGVFFINKDTIKQNTMKTYKLMQRKNYASFVLVGKTGNMVRYNFTGGNAISSIPARLSLKDEYCQMLLEESDLFKTGVIKLEKTTSDPVAKTAPKMIMVEDVKTVSQAVDYVANSWGVVVKTAKQAKEFVNKKGYDFPNLKIKVED